ncbi:MAG TPA: hypothetical protein VNW25_01510 [Candidatus Sulfotelmatobacter sp.]|nr:hypothetical protein [Candidatus Sulfotelmatobacter sp.]
MSTRKRVIFARTPTRFLDSCIVLCQLSRHTVTREYFPCNAAAYTIILLLYYAYHGALFQYTLGIFFLAALPITLYLGRTRNFLRELTPFITLLLSYEALQA